MEIEEKLGNTNQKLFDLKLMTTKIEEKMNECDRKMKGVEASRDRVERELIRMQGEIVGKREYEGEMKEMKRKMHSLESKSNEVSNMNVTLENFIDRYECIRV